MYVIVCGPRGLNTFILLQPFKIVERRRTINGPFLNDESSGRHAISKTEITFLKNL